MKGIIYHINIHTNTYVVKLDNGEFSVFKLNDIIDLKIGDIILGELNLYGLNFLTNQTDGIRFMADIDKFNLNEIEVKKLI